jgi:hypothetical protein
VDPDLTEGSEGQTGRGSSRQPWDPRSDLKQRRPYDACWWNAAYSVHGLEKKINTRKANVGIDGEYKPSPFGFGSPQEGLERTSDITSDSIALRWLSVFPP